MKSKSEIGSVIRQRRISCNLSQSSLAKSMELSRQHLANIENGHRYPSLPTLYKLEEKLEFRVG